MPIQKFYVASSSPYKQYSQTFNSSSTWTCPVGTTEVDVFAVGGGGGSGGFDWNTTQYYGVSGGGGGGQIFKKTLSVVPGTTYNVYVGAGGAGGYSSLSGQIGGLSGFNNSYTLINGIIQQPSSSNNRYRYISTSGSLTSPPSYNNANYNMTSTNYFYPGGNPAVNTALDNGVTRAIYLGGGSQYQGTYFWVPVKPNTLYTASAYYASSSTSTTSSCNVRIEWYSSLYGSQVSVTNGNTNSSILNTWTRLDVSGTSPSNATYALVRYQCAGTSPSVYITAPQFEEGSLSSFKSPEYNAPAGSRVVQNLGLIQESSDTLLVAGGGGGQQITLNNTQGWYSSQNVNRPEYSGSGGGASFWTGSSYPFIGGNGASYDGDVGDYSFQVNNYTVTNASIDSSRTDIAFSGVPSGGDSMRGGTTSTGAFHITRVPNSYEGVYGAGGLGARYSSVSNTQVNNPSTSYGGRHALPNTGAGGSGINDSSSTNQNRNMYGSNGGSGIVILKWMGQA